eukprot:12274472-Alexandrium_andersonii.AAC.1
MSASLVGSEMCIRDSQPATASKSRAGAAASYLFADSNRAPCAVTVAREQPGPPKGARGS